MPTISMSSNDVYDHNIPEEQSENDCKFKYYPVLQDLGAKEIEDSPPNSVNGIAIYLSFRVV